MRCALSVDNNPPATGNRKRAITDLGFTLLNLAMTVASCFLLNDLTMLIRVGAVLAFLLLCVLIPSLSDRLQAFRKMLMTVSVFLSLFLTAYIILDLTGWIYYLQDFDVIKEFILSTKQWGVIVYLLLTIFQVVVLPIPAAVTILIGEAIYGAFWAFVLSTVGTYIGAIIVFCLGRTFGKRLASWMFGEEKTEKYTKLLGEKGKWLFVIMLLFPFFPDDLLCMTAGISKMSTKFFLISMMLTRPVMIALTAFFGGGDIIPFKGWGIPVWIGIFAAVATLFVVITVVRKRIEKGRKGERRGKRSGERVERKRQKNGQI